MLWMLGYPTQVYQRSQEALTIARALSHSLSLDIPLRFAARLHAYQRDIQEALAQAQASVAFSTEQGLVQGVAFGRILTGWALAMLGQTEALADQRHCGRHLVSLFVFWRKDSLCDQRSTEGNPVGKVDG
jgi:hypothetical protein